MKLNSLILIAFVLCGATFGAEQTELSFTEALQPVNWGETGNTILGITGFFVGIPAVVFIVLSVCNVSLKKIGAAIGGFLNDGDGFTDADAAKYRAWKQKKQLRRMQHDLKKYGDMYYTRNKRSKKKYYSRKKGN